MHCVLQLIHYSWCIVNGTEWNFISLLRNFKIYIQGAMLLPKIVLRNRIRDMLGGEKGKTIFRGIKNKFRFLSENISSLWTKYWYIGRVRTSRLLLLSLWQSLSRGGFHLSLANGCDPITALTACQQKYPLKLSAQSIEEQFMLDQRCGRETSPGWARRHYSCGDSWKQVERIDWDDNKQVFW